MSATTADVPVRRRPSLPDRDGLRPPARDVALAAVLWLADSFVIEDYLQRGMPVIEMAYSLLGFLPLCWRRRAPVAVLALVALHGIGAALWFNSVAPLLNVVVALYAVGAYAAGRMAGVVAILASISTALVALTRELDQVQGDRTSYVTLVLGFYAAICAASWGVGRWARRSRATIEDLEERRARAAEEAVTQERKRIATELHDIVSHSVSVMVLQAAGARRIIAQEPTRAADALEHIEDIGKQSMDELRRLLGVLRDGQFLAAEEYDRLQPGLKDLDEYLATVRASGLEVRLVTEGEPVRLDPSVDTSAYRIVREALTNSAKYAGPGSTAEVRLAWHRGELVIDVSDDGLSPVEDALGTGHGLVGLFERARAVGGRLEAGPADSGGFRVHATLPVPDRNSPNSVPNN